MSSTFLHPRPQKPQGADLARLMSPDALAYVELGFTAIMFGPVGSDNIAAEQISLETLRNAENVVKKVREAVWFRPGRRKWA